jgi:hypothetical protein
MLLLSVWMKTSTALSMSTTRSAPCVLNYFNG